MKHRSRQLVLGLVCALITTRAWAAPDASPHSRAGIEAGLKSLPVYAVMAEYYPTDFGRMVDIIAKAYAEGAASHEIAMAARPVYLELIARESVKANDDNTMTLIRLTRNEAAAALRSSPKACLAVLGLAKDATLPSEFLPEDLTKSELEFAAILLRQAATAPAPPPPPVAQEDLNAVSVKAYDALPSKTARKTFSSLGGDFSAAQTPDQQEAACQFSIALFDQLITMPSGKGAPLFRALSARAPSGS